MGGLHAAMSASLSSYPVGVIAWLAPPDASIVFGDGLLSSFIHWENLEKELKKKNISTPPRVVLKQFLSLTNLNANFPAPSAGTAHRTFFVLGESDQYIPYEYSKAEFIKSAEEKWENANVVSLPGIVN